MDNQIPAQVEGTQIDASATTEFTTPRAAVVFHEIAKKRLLNVSAWSEICEVPLSTFKLTDATGNTVNRDATEGDYIRIDIPGPGTHSGDGFDWVRIEKITEEIAGDTATLSLRARPSANPANEDPAIAHFFTQHATSTFQVKRVGHRVFAEEHGRNEVPNTDTSILTDNIRNTLVGWSAKLGLSYPQWKSLVKGIAATEQA